MPCTVCTSTNVHVVVQYVHAHVEYSKKNLHMQSITHEIAYTFVAKDCGHGFFASKILSTLHGIGDVGGPMLQCIGDVGGPMLRTYLHCKAPIIYANGIDACCYKIKHDIPRMQVVVEHPLAMSMSK